MAAPDMHFLSETVVLLLGQGSLDEQALAEHRQLAAALAERLELPVELGFAESAAPPLADALLACAARRPRRVVVLPLAAGGHGHHEAALPPSLRAWAQTQMPGTTIVEAAPLAGFEELLPTLLERAAAAPGTHEPTQTAVLLFAVGSPEAQANAEVAALARLLWEQQHFGWVEYAFLGIARPALDEGVARCMRLGAERVVVLPVLLFAGRELRFAASQVARVQVRHPAAELRLAGHIGPAPEVVEALARRFALAGRALPLAPGHSHGVNAILPPRYQGGGTVSAAPMPAAALVYDAEGNVAWDRVWGGDDANSPFCELALAGGPPHRESLLEPVPAAQAEADWPGYTRVVSELVRGIGMTTGLHAVLSRAPGWVGVQCESEEMAVWLLRAIVVENVAVRREGRVLLLPAGPQFRLDHEIRNVITALAKTYHYWNEHING